MDMIITPSRLRGKVVVPSSKSELHRAIICASLCNTPTVIKYKGLCDDVKATLSAVTALGARVVHHDGGITVHPVSHVNKNMTVNVGESASSLRFMLPVSSALGAEMNFATKGRLSERPLAPLLGILKENGVTVEKDGTVFRTSGILNGSGFSADGGISSQFISGLLLSLPVLGGGSVAVTGKEVSSGYIRLTVDIMRKFGVGVEKTGNIYSVSGNYASPGEFITEGDWSAGSFWRAAAYLGCDIQTVGLNEASTQADRVVSALWNDLGGRISVSEIPDAAPILAAVGAVVSGSTELTETKRLRYKESDRVLSVVNMINSLGGSARYLDDSVVIDGKNKLVGGTADSAGDHRIAMAAAILSVKCTNKVIIKNAECVNKSYPAFWDDFRSLGGITEISEE